MNPAFRITDARLFKKLCTVQFIPCHHKIRGLLLRPVELFHQALSPVNTESRISFFCQLFSFYIGKPALTDGTTSLLQKQVQSFNKMWAHIVVAVHKCQIFTFRQLNACIPCPGKSFVLLMNHLDSVIFSGIGITNGRTPVRRPVVHQNHFQILIGLGKNTFHTPFQILFYPVNRYNYTDQWGCHVRLLRISCSTFTSRLRITHRP